MELGESCQCQGGEEGLQPAGGIECEGKRLAVVRVRGESGDNSFEVFEEVGERNETATRSASEFSSKVGWRVRVSGRGRCRMRRGGYRRESEEEKAILCLCDEKEKGREG